MKRIRENFPDALFAQRRWRSVRECRCSYCKAEPNELCHTRSGTPYGSALSPLVHQARLNAWLTKRGAFVSGEALQG